MGRFPFFSVTSSNCVQSFLVFVVRWGQVFRVQTTAKFLTDLYDGAAREGQLRDNTWLHTNISDGGNLVAVAVVGVAVAVADSDGGGGCRARSRWTTCFCKHHWKEHAVPEVKIENRLIQKEKMCQSRVLWAIEFCCSWKFYKYFKFFLRKLQ